MPFELGERGEDVEDEFARRTCRVDHAVADRPKPDALFTQIPDESDEMSHRSSKSVQSPDDQRIARLEALQAVAEARPVIPGSRQLVGEDRILPDAVLGEGVKLQAKILVICAYAGVSDKSPALRRGVHDAVLWCESEVLRITTVKTRPADCGFGPDTHP